VRDKLLLESNDQGLSRILATPAQEFSALRTSRLRPLPIALAHELAAMSTSPEYRFTLGRLYRALSEAQQAQCQAELARLGRGNQIPDAG
jgi:hypothetical protein